MPDEQPQSTRKRPGGALDALLRRTINLKQAADINWLPGEAQSRLARAPLYALPPDQLSQFMEATGQGQASGVTFTPQNPEQLRSMKISSAMNLPNFAGGSPYVGSVSQYLQNNPQGMPIAIIPQPGREPLNPQSQEAITARHEIAHQGSLPFDFNLDIPDRAMDFLKARGYKDPAQYGTEYLARMASAPEELGQTDETGKQAISDFIKQIERQDPSMAARWRQKYNIAAPSTAQADRSSSNPNVTF